MNTIKQNPYLFGGLLALLIIVLGMIAFAVSARGKSKGHDDVAKAEVSEEAGLETAAGEKTKGASEHAYQAGDASVQVSDQPSGRAVVVSQATLPETGWVVVRETKDGGLWNALGAARREAGTHKDIVVDLLRGTEPGKRYAVVIYADDGNKAFDLHGDTLIESSRADFTAETPSGAAGQ